MNSRKLVIGIGIEAATAYGRQIMRGITRFANLRREWIMITDFDVHAGDIGRWPTCDGIVAAVAEEAPLAVLRNKCKHLIACSGGAPAGAMPVVSMDDIAVSHLAADHLVECRLKHFAFYGWGLKGLGQVRLKHFEERLAARRYSVDACPVPFVWNRHPLSFVQAEIVPHWPAVIAWLKSLPKPVGILAADDMCAFDLAAACLHGGIRVPDEVAIIGVNNDDLLCESAWPPLSSVECDYQRVGYTAAEMLDRLLRGERLCEEQRCRRLPPIGVVRRQSTDPLSIGDPDLMAAVAYIRDHACDPCAVDDVLQHVVVTRRWLERRFAERMGRSPYEQILYTRIQRAQELLSRTSLSLFEVAQQCGFSSTRQFSRQFERFAGEKPGAYRRARKRR